MRPTSCGQDVSRSKAMSSNAGSNGGLHEGKHLGTKWRQKVFGLLVEIAMENPERLVVPYVGKLRRMPDQPMEDAGNAVYLIFWRLFLPEFLPYYHLADLETIGDVWESIFGYAYLRGVHPQQELGKPCGQRSPPMLRFMLLMTWCIRAVRHFLPTQWEIKHGEYYSVNDLRRDVRKHFRQCALPGP